MLNLLLLLHHADEDAIAESACTLHPVYFLVRVFYQLELLLVQAQGCRHLIVVYELLFSCFFVPKHVLDFVQIVTAEEDARDPQRLLKPLPAYAAVLIMVLGSHHSVDVLPLI